MSSINIAEKLQKAIDKFKYSSKNEMNSVLIIFINNLDNLGILKNKLSEVIGKLENKDGVLFKVGCKDEIFKNENAVIEILKNTNDLMLDDDFESEWLKKYINIQFMGVGNIHIGHQVDGDTEGLIHKYKQDNDKYKQFKKHEKEIRDAILKYSDSDWERDNLNYLVENLEISKEYAKLIVNTTTREIKEKLGNKVITPMHSIQEYTMIIDKKNKKINGCENKPNGKHSVYEAFDRVNFDRSIGYEREGIIESILSHISKKNKVENIKLNNKPFKTQIPLNNTKNILNPVWRLSRELVEIEKKFGKSELKILVEYLYDCKVSCIKYKQSEKFKNLIVEHSKVMDKKPFTKELCDTFLNQCIRSEEKTKNTQT